MVADAMARLEESGEPQKVVREIDRTAEPVASSAPRTDRREITAQA
jgi:hypothetical protein